MNEPSRSNLPYNFVFCIHLPNLIYYGLTQANDPAALLLLVSAALQLAALAGPSRQKVLLFATAALALVDLLLKILVVSEGIEGWKSMLDLRIVDGWKDGIREIWSSLSYVGMVVGSWTLAVLLQVKKPKKEKEEGDMAAFLRFLSDCVDYVLPLLLYLLCYTKLTKDSFREWIEHLNPELLLSHAEMFQQAAWGLLTAISLLAPRENAFFRHVLTISIACLLVRDHNASSNEGMELYALRKWWEWGVKAGMMISLRIRNKQGQLNLVSEEGRDDSSSRLSSYQKYSLKRKLTLQQERNPLKVVILIVLVVAALVVTDGLGNILTAVGVAINLPTFYEKSFRRWLGMGITISLLLQPGQWIYCLLLYLARRLQTNDHGFQLRNWWGLLQAGRVGIMLSRVSLLNFLIGLTQYEWLVLFTIIFRTTCSFFRIVIVFMGTEDNYTYLISNIIPASITTDLLLWAYLLLKRLHSPSANAKFAGTEITDIFREYPIILRVEKGLKVLRVFQWIACGAISLLILHSQPSFFTLLRLLPLLGAFTVGILQAKGSDLQLRLWSCNFYIAFFIAFVKYFYLLSKYDNLSPWLLAILDPLTAHAQFIGLLPPDLSSLVVTFAPDCALIVTNAIVLFIIKVELSQINYLAQRRRVIEDEHLQQVLISQEQSEQERKEEGEIERNIHYLYKNYIKPVEIKFTKTSKLRPFLADCISEAALLALLILFHLFSVPHHSASLFPHFLLFLIGSYKGTRPGWAWLFPCLIGVSSLNLLWLYCSYFLALIQGTDSHYDLTSIISKYLILILAVIFNSTHTALRRFHKQNKPLHREQPSYLFRLLAPPFMTQPIRREVLLLYLHLFRTLAFGFFIAQLLTGSQTVQFSHIVCLLALFISPLIPGIHLKDVIRVHWPWFFLAALMFDLWSGVVTSFMGLLFVRGQSMLMEQFQSLVITEKYGQYSKSSNEEMRERVEEVEMKFGQQGRLEAISEVKEARQLSSFVSFGGDDSLWKLQYTYSTIVWLLPLALALLSMLGALCCASSLFGIIIFSLLLAAILYILCFLQTFNFLSLPFKLIMLTTAIASLLFFVYSLWNSSNYSLSNGIGVFFLLFGLIGYFSLWRGGKPARWDNEYYGLEFVQNRSKEALQYWEKKCQMVSELGSQIHNEKKLGGLRKFFVERENLAVKVGQLTKELEQKSNHRKSRFESLQKLQQEEEKSVFKKEEFEVYSNMLTFMSLDDLHHCYLQLNQYYPAEAAAAVDLDLAKETAKVRRWVLDNFKDSLADTLAQYGKKMLKNVKKIQKMQLQQIAQERELEDEILKSEEQGEVKNEQPLPRDRCGERIDERLNELSWISRKLVQNMEILGLIVTAGWNFFGGVYTIPTNVAIFAWAIVLQTKTTVLFWLFLLGYCSLVVACKLLLPILPDHTVLDFILYYHPHDYLYEYLIIAVCTVEIVFLKMGGTSQLAYSQRQNIYDAFYRTLLNQAARGMRRSDQQAFLSIYRFQREAARHSFFHRVFSRGRLKPGKDLYPLLAIVQLIILLYIFFFYDMMEFESKNNRKSLGEILTVTQFSKNMILALFFQVLTMIADRVLVSLNVVDPINQKLENFCFGITFQSPQEEGSNLSPPSGEELQKLGRFDYLLIGKYLFHIFMLVAINFFVYFYIPSGGLQKSIIPQCANAVCGKSYSYLSVFLFLYLIYFVISGLQIKHGFNRNKCRNTLMERHHWIDYYLYMFFTGVPFLWEFKKISDWTTTATALPLFHWMKFEDINARMYQSKCQAQILKAKTLGKGPWYKFLMGPAGFLFILALVFSPIIMYSSFNPFAVQDSILAASFRLQLVMDHNIIYDFFETSHTAIVDDSNSPERHRQLLGLFDRARLYKLETSSYPDQDFTLSEPAVQQLSNHLQMAYLGKEQLSFQLRLQVNIAEKEGGDSTIEWGSRKLDEVQLQSLHALILSRTEEITIENFYSPFPGEIGNYSIVLTTHNQGQYFQLRTYLPEQSSKRGLFVFYKSSVKYKVAFGLLTFYLTYVVLINSLFRVYLTGGLQTVLFEGCELQKILFLCDAVRSARILENFVQEEYLYFSLVDLMRYPKMIKDIAEDFTQARKIHAD